MPRFKTLKEAEYYAAELEKRIAALEENGCGCRSWPRPGFRNPTSARIAAQIFFNAGIFADDIRRDLHPEDMLFNELADAIDALTGKRKRGIATLTSV